MGFTGWKNKHTKGDNSVQIIFFIEIPINIPSGLFYKYETVTWVALTVFCLEKSINNSQE